MNNLLNNKKFLVALLVAFILLLVVIITIGVTKKQPEPNDTAIVPASGLVDPEDKLLNNVTASDFSYIQDRFMEFLESQNIDISSEVTIVSVEPPYREQGPVKIMVNIPAINEQNMEVLVDYYTEPDPTFSIPSKNYSISLYGNSTD